MWPAYRLRAMSFQRGINLSPGGSPGHVCLRAMSFQRGINRDLCNHIPLYSLRAMSFQRGINLIFFIAFGMNV